MHKKSPLVLDFDGVICDSFNESLLVVWNGAGSNPPVEFSVQGLGALPPDYVERFTRYRPYVRHLGHFLVALLSDLPSVDTQEAFEAVYQSIDRARKEAFIQAVSLYRQQVRQAHPATWLQMQRCYRGIIRYLCRREGPVYIVTARDQASVLQLLENKGLILAPEWVLGEQSPKLDALAAIAQREQVAPGKLIFIDDQRANVQAALQAGYQAYLAGWGYPAPLASSVSTSRLVEIRLRDLLAERFPETNGTASLP